MALELSQQLKLSQQIFMTPMLQQAIGLLQLSRLELLETVQQELVDNPFLEEDSGEDDAAENNPEIRQDGIDEDGYGREINCNADWEDYLGEFASTPCLLQAREFESSEEIAPLEGRCSAKPTLESHLLWQLCLSTMSETQKNIGEAIIGNLSSSGYLQAALKEIADMASCTVSEAGAVLERVQLFDPVGVAARSARECLLVQLKNLRYDRDPVLVELVESHLEDIEAKRYRPLLRKFRLDMNNLKKYLDIIQSLDPMPGASFGGGEPTYVSPDVYVYKIDNEFVILFNEDGLPQLHLSSLYHAKIKLTSEQEKEYCSEKMRSAAWMIKSLYQRQRTLYKVMESIVRHQQDFFEYGVTKLSPLILKDIADDIDMHESTISRITTNKYVATPHGIFQLKFFFNSGLELDDGSQVGSESVKAQIKKFIAEEDANTPLSDERIGEMLKRSLKVNIARRTVAKYRTSLDIPSSSRRRKYF
ncbi:RNA polymerase factor sigma-54 [Candidatus Desulfovibrio trichonymphae]|uniref:RNA polymerase sigma 54 subunit RpoN n=1 Tax=Candidatus Desulfovibrio trichonymphae TaxID=1725232 RepID=A0A1J1DW77_9BACT|nr:RNA polymerase factor sigma-54 [Candidatus Desulfovibrio trichonymphae]BAV92124.1 RNA polymerase sigma 54 subunit RpoN [Candidatus Desulfovibrio trichonymphae]GHU99914.1 RNA polymerase sigma-54 factor [Deltaproteobacteria bacterium]